MHLRGSGTNGNITLNWTIGEPVAKTLSNGANTLTQGFQQGTLTITQIDEKLPDVASLAVYPNPTQDKLTVKLTNAENKKIQYDIYTIGGRLITTVEIKNNEEVIDLTAFTTGTYILKMYSANEFIKLYQIIKQ